MAVAIPGRGSITDESFNRAELMAKVKLGTAWIKYEHGVATAFHHNTFNRSSKITYVKVRMLLVAHRKHLLV